MKLWCLNIGRTDIDHFKKLLNSSASESSLGSLGSSEQLLDSDSELEESGQRNVDSHIPQASEASIDDDQLSYRDSLDLSSQSATHTDPEQEGDQDPDNQEGAAPPMLPESGPPDDETEVEQDLSVRLAELNVNQSNNYPCSPVLSLSGLPLAPLCGKKLPLTRNRDSEPEFV